MPEYRVTFGSQYGGQDYGADPHPVGGYDFVHRDGWWTIVAPDESDARTLILAVLGTGWSNVYDQWQVRNTDERGAGLDWPAMFPRGELLRLIHPAMADRPVALLEGPVPPHMIVPTGDEVTGRVLVTVWGNGTGEVAYRPEDDTHVTWGPPAALAPRMS
jgi:hypothetical protein